MKKAELMEMVGRPTKVTFKDGEIRYGVLEYVTEFSAKYGYKKVGYFSISDISFLVSHIKKCEVF